MGPRLSKAAILSCGLLLGALLMAPLAPPAAAQGRAARPNVVRPDGPVWEVIRTNCISCHGIDDYAFYSMDRAGWQKLILDKHKDRNVKLSDQDMSTLLDWVSVKFGPDTKPFPRSYIPQEITTFFSDPEAYRMLNARCTVCHELTRVSNERNAEDQWRIIILDMRERGAKISDDEIEHLVEWLGRVWGTNQDK